MAGVFNFRLPDDLKKYLANQAKRNRTSISHYIVMLIFLDMMDKDHADRMECALKNGIEKVETVTDQAV